MHDLSVLQAEVTKAALDDASSYVALIQSLATGALVFSAGFLSGPLQFSIGGRLLLILGWSAFVISIFAGILARGAIVSQKANGNDNIHTAPLLLTSGASVLSFFLGAALFGVALILAVLQIPNVATFKAARETDALRIAFANLARIHCAPPVKVVSVELVSGIYGERANKTWDISIDSSAVHVPFNSQCKIRFQTPRKILVDAQTGAVVMFP